MKRGDYFKPLFPIKDIFYSLQGEGAFVGTPTVFVRFHGCNLDCPFCDEGGRDPRGTPTLRSVDYIVERIKQECPDADYVVLTGGEPALQLQDKMKSKILKKALKPFTVAIETNGTLPVPRWLDWVTWSPKNTSFPFRLQVVNEIKALMEDTGNIYGVWSPYLLEEKAKQFWCPLYIQPITYTGRKGVNQTEQAKKEALDFLYRNSNWIYGSRLHNELKLK